MRRKTDKKTVLLRIAGCFFGALFIGSLTMLLLTAHRLRKEEQAFDQLAAIIRQSVPDKTAAPAALPKESSAPTPQSKAPEAENAEEVPNSPEFELPTPEPAESTPLPQYVPLAEQNPDFFGWITIPDTGIDYPVMYTPKRPNYYLGHAFDGSNASTGVPFLDAECDPQGSYLLIYGHHPKNGTMFAPLEKYEEESYWSEHPLIQFDTLYEKRTYRIAAAMKLRVLKQTEKDGFRYYAYKSLKDENTFEEYCRQVRENALYDTETALSFGDELLVLSTCNYHTGKGRFVVVAKRVS